MQQRGKEGKGTRGKMTMYGKALPHTHSLQRLKRYGAWQVAPDGLAEQMDEEGGRGQWVPFRSPTCPCSRAKQEDGVELHNTATDQSVAGARACVTPGRFGAAAVATARFRTCRPGGSGGIHAFG